MRNRKLAQSKSPVPKRKPTKAKQPSKAKAPVPAEVKRGRGRPPGSLNKKGVTPKPQKAPTPTKAYRQPLGTKGLRSKLPQVRRKPTDLTSTIASLPEITPQAITERIDSILPLAEQAGMTRQDLEEKAAIDPVTVMALMQAIEETTREEYRLMQEIKQYEDTHKTNYFTPFQHQALMLQYVRSGKRTVLMVGANQIGKEQPVDCIVYGPNGPFHIGDISVGYSVFDEDGNVCQVTGVYPQGVKPVYRMTFDDESSVESGLDHQWKVRTPSNRFKKNTRNGYPSPTFEEWQVVSTKTLIDQFGNYPDPSHRCSIPMTTPVSFYNDTTYVIHPYVIGVLIGDGGLHHSPTISCHDNDIEIINRVTSLLPIGHTFRKGSNFDYIIRGHNQKNYILTEVRRMGLNVLSQYKFIPDEYKYTSSENRIELLRGLMDTDGSVYGKGVCEFSTTSERLAYDIQWLVWSLGGKCKIKRKPYIYNDELRVSYRLMVKIHSFNPFFLKRKADKHYVVRYRNERLIYKIEYSRHVECVCISVSSPLKTYLTNDFIVTHNTIFGTNVAGAFSNGCKAPWDKEELFPSRFSRENNGKGVIGRILTKDWEKGARDVIVPKLKEWLAAETYETKKNNVGVEYEWYFPRTKSKFTICTYNEDTMSQEGWTGDWVWADEPPPRDKYVTNSRGLIARGGIFIMTMTAISEPWILDEIVLNPDTSTGIVADIPIEANTTLTEEDIRIYASKLTEDEKVARIKGGWLQLTGRIWKGFYPTPMIQPSGSTLCHVVEEFDIPPHWPVEFQIDFHLLIPHAISFTACDEYGRYWVCEEVWQNCSSEELADTIIRLTKQNTWRLTYGEIDPLSKGDTSYIKNRFGKAEDSFTIIKNRLRPAGIRLGVGSKDEKSYIKEVEKRLRGVNGPNPTLYIMSNCVETIKQVTRWSYDDNGRPKDDGHFPECIGRQSQTGMRYRPVEEESGIDYGALKARLNEPIRVNVG